jgi:DNA-binding transcriptional ArsR family regulator
MQPAAAVKALSALAQETRLEVFRRLIVAGPSGLAAGIIAALTGTPGPTLTFHLKELEAAGLIERRREGRNILYRADFTRMRALVAFLAQDCCKGDPELAKSQAAACCPVAASTGRKRAEAAPARRKRQRA